jgi:hypothetical protein
MCTSYACVRDVRKRGVHVMMRSHACNQFPASSLIPCHLDPPNTYTCCSTCPPPLKSTPKHTTTTTTTTHPLHPPYTHIHTPPLADHHPFRPKTHTHHTSCCTPAPPQTTTTRSRVPPLADHHILNALPVAVLLLKRHKLGVQPLSLMARDVVQRVPV